MARDYFEDIVINREISISDGFRLINDPERLVELLKAAESEYVRIKAIDIKEQEDKRLAEISNNTSFKSSMKVGIASGIAVGFVFLLASPFVTELLQPTAKKLAGRSPEPTDEPRPAQGQSSAPPNITINCPDTCKDKNKAPEPKTPTVRTRWKAPRHGRM